MPDTPVVNERRWQAVLDATDGHNILDVTTHLGDGGKAWVYISCSCRSESFTEEWEFTDHIRRLVFEALAEEPTMPDTLTPERIAAMREYLSRLGHGDIVSATMAQDLLAHIDALRGMDEVELRALAGRLLAHIDALTAAVEGLPPFGVTGTVSAETPLFIDRAAVLAILRGES